MMSGTLTAFAVAKTLTGHRADAMMAAPFVARDWHGGQFTAMYSLASSGAMVPGLAAEASRAAEVALNAEGAEDAEDAEALAYDAEVLAVLAEVAEAHGL